MSTEVTSLHASMIGVRGRPEVAPLRVYRIWHTGSAGIDHPIKSIIRVRHCLPLTERHWHKARLHAACRIHEPFRERRVGINHSHVPTSNCVVCNCGTSSQSFFHVALVIMTTGCVSRPNVPTTGDPVFRNGQCIAQIRYLGWGSIIESPRQSTYGSGSCRSDGPLRRSRASKDR